MTDLKYSFPITAGDFMRAGQASSKIKSILKRLGIDSSIVRRMSIAAYEGEINLVIHSLGGELMLDFKDGSAFLTTTDTGPGIPDIEKAMQAGFSTASEDARLMGFGAGMGLPNMRRCADDFDVKSKLGCGTQITMKFDLGTQ